MTTIKLAFSFLTITTIGGFVYLLVRFALWDFDAHPVLGIWMILVALCAVVIVIPLVTRVWIVRPTATDTTQDDLS